jgi:hypothetical protein
MLQAEDEPKVGEIWKWENHQGTVKYFFISERLSGFFLRYTIITLGTGEERLIELQEEALKVYWRKVQ